MFIYYIISYYNVYMAEYLHVNYLITSSVFLPIGKSTEQINLNINDFSLSLPPSLSLSLSLCHSRYVVVSSCRLERVQSKLIYILMFSLSPSLPLSLSLSLCVSVHL